MNQNTITQFRTLSSSFQSISKSQELLSSLIKIFNRACETPLTEYKTSARLDRERNAYIGTFKISTFYKALTKQLNEQDTFSCSSEVFHFIHEWVDMPNMNPNTLEASFKNKSITPKTVYENFKCDRERLGIPIPKDSLFALMLEKNGWFNEPDPDHSWVREAGKNQTAVTKNVEMVYNLIILVSLFAAYHYYSNTFSIGFLFSVIALLGAINERLFAFL